MIGRRMLLSSIICSLLLSSPARAQDTHRADQTAQPVTDRGPVLDLKDSISLSPDLGSTRNWLDSVTMSRLPSGSLITRFDGFHGFVMKQLRGQCRQFVRQATDRGWYVQPDTTNRTLYWSAYERDWVGMGVNGPWWTRSWMESREAEDGGAPAVPFVHTYGRENRWRRGPFQLTNTLKFKFDYLAFFEVNPDPVEAQDQPQQSPIALDVGADRELALGTTVIFKLRPKLRIGMPKTLGLEGLIRGASLEASFEIVRWDRTIAKGEFQVQWRDDEVVFSFDLRLATW